MENAKNLRGSALYRRVQTRVLARTAPLFALVIVLCALAVIPCGCGRQLGETRAEAHRRRIRNQRINRQEILADVDAILLDDKPSRCTSKRIP
jgi:hypothetical protein